MLHFLNNTDPDVLSPVITDTMDNIAFSGIKSIGQSLFGVGNYWANRCQNLNYNC